MGFPHSFLSPRTLLCGRNPQLMVTPEPSLAMGHLSSFSLGAVEGRDTLLIPDTGPATHFLHHSSLSLIYLCPHILTEAS